MRTLRTLLTLVLLFLLTSVPVLAQSSARSTATGIKVFKGDSLVMNVVTDSASYSTQVATTNLDARVRVFGGNTPFVTGQAVSGTGIPGATTISLVNGTGTFNRFGQLHTSTTIDNLVQTSDIVVGMGVTCGRLDGCSIPAGTFVTVVGGTSVTLNQATSVTPSIPVQVSFWQTLTLSNAATQTIARNTLTITNTQTFTLGAVEILQNDTSLALASTISPTVNYALPTPASIALSEGTLQGVTIQLTASQGKVDRYSSCATAQIVRAGVPIQTLMVGFPTKSDPLFWPGGTSQSCADGPGHARIFIQAAPNAGEDFIITVPDGALWELISVGDELVASTVQVTRGPYLVIDDGGNAPFALFPRASSVGHTPTQDILYSWISGGTQLWDTNGNSYTAPLPSRLRLVGGNRIKSTTIFIQPGDQWNTPSWQVISWFNRFQ